MPTKPMTLMTVSEAARALRVSDDTIRRQIKEGDLQAILIGTTPKGRPRYRIAQQVIHNKLGTVTDQEPSAIEQIRQLFSVLNPEQQEELLSQAIDWVREHSAIPDTTPRKPEPAIEDLKKRYTGKRFSPSHD